MKKTLVILMVVAFAASYAAADVSFARFRATRDNGMKGHPAEVNVNTGALEVVRFKKMTQESILMDFDKDAILAWMDENPPLAEGYVVYLELVGAQESAGEFEGLTFDIRTCDSALDWVEGDRTAALARLAAVARKRPLRGGPGLEVRRRQGPKPLVVRKRREFHVVWGLPRVRPRMANSGHACSDPASRRSWPGDPVCAAAWADRPRSTPRK